MNTIYEILAVFIVIIGTPLTVFWLGYLITGSISVSLIIVILFLIGVYIWVEWNYYKNNS